VNDLKVVKDLTDMKTGATGKVLVRSKVEKTSNAIKRSHGLKAQTANRISWIFWHAVSVCTKNFQATLKLLYNLRAFTP
jgi:hypothetical protein